MTLSSLSMTLSSLSTSPAPSPTIPAPVLPLLPPSYSLSLPQKYRLSRAIAARVLPVCSSVNVRPVMSPSPPRASDTQVTSVSSSITVRMPFETCTHFLYYIQITRGLTLESSSARSHPSSDSKISTTGSNQYSSLALPILPS